MIQSRSLESKFSNKNTGFLKIKIFCFTNNEIDFSQNDLMILV